MSLEDQLKVYGEEDADPLPQQLMQKYIAYARTFVHPTLSPDAKQVILFHPNFADQVEANILFSLLKYSASPGS